MAHADRATIGRACTGVRVNSIPRPPEPPKRLDFVAFFEGEARRHAEAHAQAEARAAAARASLPALVGEATAAKAALDDKLALKERTEEEGLDTTRLDGPIAELRARLEDAIARRAAREAELAVPTGPRRSFDRELALARSVRDALGVHEGIVIAELRDCYPFVTVEEKEQDEAGQPSRVEVRFGQAPGVGLGVRTAQARVSARFRPKALEWVPEPPAAHPGEVESPDVFLDPARARLVLSSRHLYESSIFGRAVRDLRHAELALSLEEHLDEALRGAEALDLDRPADDELLEIVRNKTLALTSLGGVFRPTDLRLPSPEIATRLRDDWGALVACPWAADVKGALALLKYHAENGEKARFWCEGHEGHYGFRLRTRDHTWLVGELFVSPSEPPPDARAPLWVPGPTGPAIAKLGRLHVKVQETK